jgi:hypothetical protein
MCNTDVLYEDEALYYTLLHMDLNFQNPKAGMLDWGLPMAHESALAFPKMC